MKDIKSLLGNGQILAVYNTKYLLSVNPAFDIDRVRFSVVPIGTKGERAADIYISTSDMRRLCADIESGVAAKKIKADEASAYPSAYKFVTGEKGSKTLAIGGGQKGIRVQTTIVGEKTEHRLVVLTYNDLRDMAYYYRLVSGEILFMKGSYLESLYKAYDGRKKYTAPAPDPDPDPDPMGWLEED